jgi:cytochrome c
MPSMLDRLAPPPTVYPPTQADLGAQVYYQVCMACHGDRGQGLTDEWRQVLDPPDRNCWQSGCHNPHHPPDGFVFPKVVPAVVGAGVLEQFQTAANLHAFIQSKMPFQAPGSLKEDEYWQLTAFLLRANGYTLPSIPLDEQTAQRLFLAPQPAQPAPKPAFINIAIGLAAGFIIILLLLILAFLGRRSRQS